MSVEGPRAYGSGLRRVLSRYYSERLAKRTRDSTGSQGSYLPIVRYEITPVGSDRNDGFTQQIEQIELLDG